MSTAIGARSLTVGHDGHPALEDVDLDVRPGTWLALVGGNGSGKTTLLKTLAGLLPPIGGEVSVLGRPPGTLPARVSYMGQHHQVNETLAVRVRDVVAMGRYAHLGLLRPSRHEDAERVEISMRRTGVSDIANVALHELSGGQRQRAYLAQSLAHEGEVLLLDEATAGIDASGRDTYLRVLEEEKARGAAIVASTHDFGEALRADQVLLLAGRVIAQGPPRQVLTRENLLEAFGISLTDIGSGEYVHGIAHHHHGDHQHDPGHDL